MNNIDSVDEERQMRKDVNKLILEKQFMTKVMSDNTYYINITSNETGNINTYNEMNFFLNGIGKDHIKSAKLSVISFELRAGGTNGFGTQATASRSFLLSISCLKNNSFFFGNVRPASTMINTNFYPMVSCENYGTSSTGNVVQIYMNREMPAMSCENPFGKELRMKVYKSDGKSAAGASTGGGTAGHDVLRMCLKIELLPDFNENDRINY